MVTANLLFYGIIGGLFGALGLVLYCKLSNYKTSR